MIEPDFQLEPHFDSALHNTNVFGQLRKESLDVYNRLHSIAEDVLFVTSLARSEEYRHLPVIANLRCGAWYTDPAIATDTPAYFKSTDGHFGNWGFNLRRPNLHLLSFIIESRGTILVDSTRAGKRIPDALSKTVPIWCCVINRAVQRLYPEHCSQTDWDTKLYTSPAAVSPQEHAQIEPRIDKWVDDLVNSSYELPRLPKPLRPLWITPTTERPPPPLSDYLSIICLSASKQVDTGEERRSSNFVYVQGSGDDHELWGLGLNPGLFWENKDRLLAAPRSQIETIVQDLVASGSTASTKPSLRPTQIMQTKLFLSTLGHLTPDPLDTEAAYLLLLPPSTDPQSLDEKSNTLIIHVHEGKKGQKQFLAEVLPLSMEFIQKNMERERPIHVACQSGKDASVSVVLTALQRFYGDDGMLLPMDQWGKTEVTKPSIKTRLQWIIASYPIANPSRATLKRVNEYLLSSPAFHAARPST